MRQYSASQRFDKSVTVVLDKLPKKETTLIIEFLQAEIDGQFRFVGSKVQIEGTEKRTSNVC